METSKNVFDKTYSDMQKFIFNNGIVVAAAGFTIALATNTAITNMFQAVVQPVIEFIKKLFFYETIANITPLKAIIEIIWIITTWIITIIIVFLLLEYFLNKTIFGMVTTVPEDKKTDFVMSKVEAKANPIIPSDDNNPFMKTKIQERETVDKIVQITREEGDKANVKAIVKNELNQTEKYTNLIYNINI